jgi:cytochrome c oxidase assembly factor CtaG
MEEDEANQPRHYVWPRYVLAGVVLGIVLAVFWMSVLVRRVHEQREDMTWPTNKAEPMWLQPTQSAMIIPPARTNSPPAH